MHDEYCHPPFDPDKKKRIKKEISRIMDDKPGSPNEMQVYDIDNDGNLVDSGFIDKLIKDDSDSK